MTAPDEKPKYKMTREEYTDFYVKEWQAWCPAIPADLIRQNIGRSFDTMVEPFGEYSPESRP